MAVDDSEIDGLGLAALVRGDLLQINAKHLAGSEGVDVFVVGEGLAELFVLTEVSPDPQLDLRIIGGEPDVSGAGGDKGSPDLSAQFATGGDILQVGPGAAESAGGGHCLVERGVEAPCFGTDHFGQHVQVGIFQLGYPAVLEDQGGEPVAVAEFFEDGHIGGETGFGLADGFEAELVEVSEYKGRAEDLGPTDRKRRRPFSILFKIENDPPLPQDIYKVEHNEMATMELFLVPIGRDGDGFLYEAVFN